MTKDLFENYEDQPENLRVICDKYLTLLEDAELDAYAVCKEFFGEVERVGYVFNYGLDGSPHSLRKA